MLGPDLRMLAFLVGLLCGAVNVLVDVDHLPSYFGIGPRNRRRFLHRGFFLVSLGTLLVEGVLEDYCFSLF